MYNYIYWIVAYRYIDIVTYTFYTYHTTTLSFYMETACNSSLSDPCQISQNDGIKSQIIQTGVKHYNQSFNELMLTNKSGHCKHLDVDCNQGLT